MKIAIVNDLPVAVEALRRALTGGPGAHHTLAWVARDGAEAVRRCAEDRPDLVLMDLVMPGMDGVEATRLIMAQTPCAILLVTAHSGTLTGKVFEAMGAGALDVVAPPTLPDMPGRVSGQDRHHGPTARRGGATRNRRAARPRRPSHAGRQRGGWWPSVRPPGDRRRWRTCSAACRGIFRRRS